MEQSLIVPELAAGRGFVLRAWRLADMSLVREAAEDAYIPLTTTVPSPWSEPAGRAFVERQWGRASSGAGYPFVIVDPDGRPVGTVGLWLRDLALGRASLGYWVVGSARGRGAAGIAVRAVAAWALKDLRIPRLELYVEPWNTASVRTAERAGFQREGLLREWQQVGSERRDMYMYSLLDGDRSSDPQA
ncbi:GNAT family N-acetyltransferase [Streptomyces narbonensis]|uniref:GNAT family N-acetyltransferase n=1 Tax=Streptomyces narbonensis TaxID=67333 RepID=A0ABV3C730_9ACTN